MIDDSEKHKHQLAFEFQNLCLYEKHSNSSLVCLVKKKFDFPSLLLLIILDHV